MQPRHPHSFHALFWFFGCFERVAWERTRKSIAELAFKRSLKTTWNAVLVVGLVTLSRKKQTVLLDSHASLMISE